MVKLLKRAEKQNNQAQNCNGFVHFNMPEFTGTDWYAVSHTITPVEGLDYTDEHSYKTLIEDYSVGYL